LKAEGNVLKGVVMNQRLGPTEIKDGVIVGSDVSFYLMRRVPNDVIRVKYDGTFDGDELHYTSDADGVRKTGIARKSKLPTVSRIGPGAGNNEQGGTTDILDILLKSLERQNGSAASPEPGRKTE
jgi:hypothetical protein